MPSAIEVHLGQVVTFIFLFKILPKKILELSKKCKEFTKSTKIIPDIPKLMLVCGRNLKN